MAASATLALKGRCMVPAAVVCSSSLLISLAPACPLSGKKTPLIDLFKFAEPALTDYQK